MSRRVPVAFFLGDAAFLSDAKFRDLARRLPDPDDFNSAVGAWFIALAQSRRNGSHLIDLEAETGTRFGNELRACGLITDEGFPSVSWKVWGAQSPQQAAAGLARASSAQRDEGGHFLPSSGPSGTSALVKLASAVQPSPPLPSSNSSTEEGGAGGRNGMEDFDGHVAYFNVTGKYPAINTALHDWIGRLAEEFGADEFQSALATEHIVSRDGRTLLSRTEARLSHDRDEHVTEVLRNRAAERAAARERRTTEDLEREEARRRRIVAEVPRPLREIVPELAQRFGKPVRPIDDRSPDAP